MCLVYSQNSVHVTAFRAANCICSSSFCMVSICLWCPFPHMTWFIGSVRCVLVRKLVGLFGTQIFPMEHLKLTAALLEIWRRRALSCLPKCIFKSIYSLYGWADRRCHRLLPIADRHLDVPTPSGQLFRFRHVTHNHIVNKYQQGDCPLQCFHVDIIPCQFGSHCLVTPKTITYV